MLKILKQTYPYIDGWRFDNNWNGKYIINIVIICDIKKVCEYYDSDLKPYYKNYNDFNDDYPYPVSVLELGSSMDSNEKWELWKEFNNTLNDIYELIPEELKLLDYHNHYKRLDPDRFEFR